MTSGNGQHCSFVLLAEFHLLEGAQLKYQFPQPLGVDEGCVCLNHSFMTLADEISVVFLLCRCYQMEQKPTLMTGPYSS